MPKGIGKLSTADGKAFADPEVLRRLTSSVSCALDEAAAALTRMRAENNHNAGQVDKYVLTAVHPQAPSLRTLLFRTASLVNSVHSSWSCTCSTPSRSKAESQGVTVVPSGCGLPNVKVQENVTSNLLLFLCTRKLIPFSKRR